MPARENVLTVDLARVINEWREKWEIERPPDIVVGFKNGYPVDKSGRNKPLHDALAESDRRGEFQPAIQWLSERTGLASRILYRIYSCETTLTSFWLADKILTALEMSYKLHNGTVTIVPRYDERPIARKVGEDGRVINYGTHQSLEDWIQARRDKGDCI